MSETIIINKSYQDIYNIIKSNIFLKKIYRANNIEIINNKRIFYRKIKLNLDDSVPTLVKKYLNNDYLNTKTFEDIILKDDKITLKYTSYILNLDEYYNNFSTKFEIVFIIEYLKTDINNFNVVFKEETNIINLEEYNEEDDNNKEDEKTSFFEYGKNYIISKIVLPYIKSTLFDKFKKIYIKRFNKYYI